jgi:transaldolase/glucose-6-phosphate isomerase
MANPLIEVQKLGQSIWYDNISRSLITSGELRRMVENDGLSGVTSNPAIFEKALAGSADYDPATKAAVRRGVGGAKDVFETLAIQDIQLAADVLYPAYVKTAGVDGYVSMEVSPYLAHDTDATIEEARRLHSAIGRDNLMIKVPATPEGIPAIKQLISEGININVTLLFAVEMYEAAAKAYKEGLEKRLAAGGDISRVAGVASFFVSRIDSLVDQKLTKLIDEARDSSKRATIESLFGQIAVANAKVAYTSYEKLFGGEQWKELKDKGARPQRLLWASTSTKNPKYSKTLYVDNLIGPDTVNTLPTETFHAFKEQGKVHSTLTEDVGKAEEQMLTLEEIGVPMQEVTDHLIADGVKKFSDAFDTLLAAVERKRRELLGESLAAQVFSLGGMDSAVKETSDEWRAEGKVRRLWDGDTSLWSGSDEDQWLGWLEAVDHQRSELERLDAVAADARDAGFRHILLLGMGGSSLCPEVMSRTFGPVKGSPELHVLDSTVPAQVKTFEKKIDPTKTLFFVSSKSGGTTEPNAFKQYFFDLVQKALDTDEAGSRFIAITDPDTKLDKLAGADRFRHVLYGVPTIGGRYSALSSFGMAPSAVMGIDVAKFIDRTAIMAQSCDRSVPPEVNPGVTLGIVLGTLAMRGRNKLTILTSPSVQSLGAWLEQLLAESAGKDGKGLIPIDDEKLGSADVYGKDRVFVYVRVRDAADPGEDTAVDALEESGQPVVRITLNDTCELGQEFFRWEIATAVAGSILGINPFNQPDVEASKVATRKLTAAFEETGELPEESPILEEGELRLFTDAANEKVIATEAMSRSFEDYLAAHLARIHPGDYFAINAYVEMNEDNREELQAIRHTIRDWKRVATTLGFGPRFLHSTGQLHKGGPNTGVFLQITSEDAEDLSVPGQKYTFGVLKRFQAQGDFEVLAERKRRVLRIHIGPDVKAGLEQLRGVVQKIVGS